MKSSKRLNFSTRQVPNPKIDAEVDTSFDAVSVLGGNGDWDVADGGSIGATAVTPVNEEVTRDMDLEPSMSRRHPLENSRDSVRQRKWTVAEEGGAPPDSSRDREIRDRIVSLVRDLNAAMDAAVRQGLIVEPVLTRIKGRYGSVDVEGGHMLSLKLLRKLC